MNKQIEKMAWDLCDIPRHPSIKSCEQCGNKDCLAMYYARRAYDNGYRKSTDVAREIFDTLHKEIVYAIKHNVAVREERVKKHGVNPYDDSICVACTAKNFALDGIDCFIASQRQKYESEGVE
jgi:hypothetical protein